MRRELTEQEKKEYNHLVEHADQISLKEIAATTYGYARISRRSQKIERQLENIRKAYPDAIIYQEAYTGTKIDGRRELNKLLKRVQPGDRIVFDSVSRMSRSKEDGVALYFELYEKGIQLVFLKESYINTSVYQEAIQQTIAVTGNEIADLYIEATNKVFHLLATKQIEKAFEQSQKEVDDLHERTREGMREARRNGKQIDKLGETNEDIKILVGWSPTITEGETSNDYAKIVVINFLTGKEERVIQCTYEGKPITGQLCANQIGCDSFGHVWIAGYLSSTLKTTGEGAAAQVTGANAQRVYQVNMETGECTIVNDFALSEDDYSVTNAGRIDYCSLVGDITLQEAPCVYMAAINGTAAPVYGFRAEQGATGAEAWQPLMNDGSYYAQNFTETYPEGQASWSYAPTAAVVKDEDFSGQLFYIDGFTTCPTLYNTTGGIVESFANAPDMAPTEVGTNGVAEFSIDNKDFVVYSLNQYAKGYDPDGKNLFCAARIAQLGEGQTFEGMKEMWVIPGNKGLGDTSDGGTRYHALDAVHITDPNGMDGVFVLTFKCYNGLAVYQVAPEGYQTPQGVSDITVNEDANAPVQYFNLNGVEVNANNLTPGIYLTRQGSKGGKVIVK